MNPGNPFATKNFGKSTIDLQNQLAATLQVNQQAQQELEHAKTELLKQKKANAQELKSLSKENQKLEANLRRVESELPELRKAKKDLET